MLWIAYLVVIHILAFIGAGVLIIGGYLWVLANWINPLTGRWLPWVRNLFPWLGD